MKQLPGKKVIFFLVIILVVTIGVLWYFGNKKKQQDFNLTKAEEEQLLNNQARLKEVVNRALASGEKMKIFEYSDLPRRASSSDLKIIDSNSSSTLKSYGLELASIFKPYENTRENENRIMLRLLEGEGKKDLESLKKMQMLYANTDKELLEMSVPKDLAFLHTKLVNRLRVMSHLVGNMSRVTEQPLLALKSGEVYQKELGFFYLTIGEISTHFNRQNLIFKPEEKINIYVNLES